VVCSLGALGNKTGARITITLRPDAIGDLADNATVMSGKLHGQIFGMDLDFGIQRHD
jgi:hypothetical protein